MSNETIKKYGKSIRSKLLNISKKEDVFHQTILTLNKRRCCARAITDILAATG